MNLFKKILLYFKYKKPIQIFKECAIGLVIFGIVFFLLIYAVEVNNRKRVYENIEKIQIGESISTAISKMKSGTLFLEYSSKKCDNCFDSNVYEIVFYHKHPHHDCIDYPSIEYNLRSGLIVGYGNGCF